MVQIILQTRIGIGKNGIRGGDIDLIPGCFQWNQSQYPLKKIIWLMCSSGTFLIMSGSETCIHILEKSG